MHRICIIFEVYAILCKQNTTFHNTAKSYQKKQAANKICSDLTIYI